MADRPAVQRAGMQRYQQHSPLTIPAAVVVAIGIAVFCNSRSNSMASVKFAPEEQASLNGKNSDQHKSPPGLAQVAVGLVGPGLVGREFMAQLSSQRTKLRDAGLDLSLVAVARSTTMQLLGLEVGRHALEGHHHTDVSALLGSVAGPAPEPANLSRLGDFLTAVSPGGPWIMVDCSAAELPPDHYGEWLAAGIHVITPNKRAGSGPWDRFQAIQTAARVGQSRFSYESTVGAGLPILSTLRDLQQSGDEVQAIEGVLSGTLSFLFSRLEQGLLFSDAVQEAVELGFTEPDPRDDLSGMDVQRKVVILARSLGLELELQDVQVESLVPEAVRSWRPTRDEEAAGIASSLVQKLRHFDHIMITKFQQAAAKEEVLRYVGLVNVTSGEVAVKLRSISKSHPLAALRHADNMVAFSTRRFLPRPLVIQGPGAGAAVTSFGIFSDLLRTVNA